MILAGTSSGELFDALRDRLKALELANVEARALAEVPPHVPEVYNNLQWLLCCARTLLAKPSPQTWELLLESVQGFGGVAARGVALDEDGDEVDEDPPDEIVELGVEAQRTVLRLGELQGLYKSRLDTCREEMEKLRVAHREEEDRMFADKEMWIGALCEETKKLIAAHEASLEVERARHETALAAEEADHDSWRVSLCAQLDRERLTAATEIEMLRSEISRERAEHQVALELARDNAPRELAEAREAQERCANLESRCQTVKFEALERPSRDPRD